MFYALKKTRSGLIEGLIISPFQQESHMEDTLKVVMIELKSVKIDDTASKVSVTAFTICTLLCSQIQLFLIYYYFWLKKKRKPHDC